MRAFELGDLVEEGKCSGKPYLEFLRVSELSMGIYQLPQGGTDPQSPHTEDEVYFVTEGKAKIRVGDEDRDVQAGSAVYVPRSVEHRFHSIEQALTVLVFFAPAEYSISSREEVQ
jgi:quercetin dioxygenase-like cupin family protein